MGKYVSQIRLDLSVLDLLDASMSTVGTV